jgi:hypothetical protein
MSNQNQEGHVSEPVSRLQPVYNALHYRVHVFGYSVNFLVLLLVTALLVSLVYYRNQHSRSSRMSDLTLSSTSSMGDIAAQMGGFSVNTPNFIKNL